MEKNIIKLNESELHQLIEECVTEMLKEGFFDQVGAAWKGMKQGYKGQKMLDRGTDNFKQHLDKEDMMNMANPMAARPENTASEQAMEAYRQYKEYQTKANQLLSLYNKIVKRYNLQKTSTGRVKSQEPQNVGFNGPRQKGYNPSANFRRNHRKMTDMPTPGTNGLR